MKRAPFRVLLLDVNVLMALAWPQHQFASAAHARLSRGEKWATCALTQLSLLRLSATRAVVPGVASLASGREVLLQLIADPKHQFLAEMPPPFGLEFAFDQMQGPGQLTDAYLLGLARYHGARLVTFDRRMATLAGPGEIEILGEA